MMESLTMPESNKTLDEAMVLLATHIKQNKPWLFQIDQELQKANDGIVNIQVRVYHGAVTDVVVSHTSRYTFKK